MDLIPNPKPPPSHPEVMDRFTNLPCVVIESILEKLPLVDQVRTSVLSSCWRHKWAKNPVLMIDQEFYKFLSTPRSIPKKQKSKTQPHANLEYLTVINSLLVQHIGHIREFLLFIPYNGQGLMPGFHLPIQSVLRHGTEHLSVLSFEYYKPHVLPIFSAVGLKELFLDNCVLRLPPAFEGFPKLTSFEQRCFSARSDSVSCLISCCPALEEVRLSGLDFCDEVLSIRAPRVHSLSLSGVFKSISLCNAQIVESLELYYTRDISSVDLDFLKSMMNLKKLNLGGYTYSILARCSALPRFDQLKTLSLYDVCLQDIDDLNCILNLSTNSPNLKELTIQLSSTDDDTSECQSIVESYRNNKFGNLSSVYIEDCDGSKTKMNLIDLLLHCSPLLELMSLTVCDSMDKSGKLSLVEHVTSFCRASPKAKVKFLK